MRGRWTVTVSVVILAASLLLFTLPGCGGGEEGGKKPIKIGVILSESGSQEPLGKPEKRAIELFVEKLNAKGGIDGHPVEVIIKDDASDPSRALQAAVELLDQEEVVAIIGSTTTGATLSIKQETNARKIPLISMAAGVEIMEGDFSYVFRTPPTSAEAAGKALDYISRVMGKKKIAILYDTNAFGTDGRDTIKRLASSYNVEITTAEGYDSNATEEAIDTHLVNVKASDPEVIVVWGTNPGPAKIAKRMKDKGINIPFMGSHGIANKTFIDLAGEAANGVLFPAGKMLIWQKALKPGTPQYELMREFSEEYSARYGEQPNTFAGHGWDAILILTEALKRAGADATPDKIRDAIEKTQGLVGTAGVFNYSPSNHNGLSPEDLVVVEIRNGAWEVAPGQE
ncbi:MAG: ABC transporter substrate-binding protein [Candidatus Geothermincolales bacterium]